MRKLKKAMCILFATCLTLLTGCYDDNTQGTVYYPNIVEKVEATVIDKDYKSSWMQPIWTGKFYTYINHSAEYNVTVEYENIRADFDNEFLYQMSNVGDKVLMDKVTYVNRKTGEPRKITLEIIRARE